MADETKIVKSGIKSTEFWITVLALIGSTVGGISGLVPGNIAGILAGISSAAYAISRGLAKK